jgi:hypothetical protein
MKEQKWFKCHDCGKFRSGEPIYAFRSPTGTGIFRVKVCSHCEHGTVPKKNGKK